MNNEWDIWMRYISLLILRLYGKNTASKSAVEEKREKHLNFKLRSNLSFNKCSCFLGNKWNLKFYFFLCRALYSVI